MRSRLPSCTRPAWSSRVRRTVACEPSGGARVRSATTSPGSSFQLPLIAIRLHHGSSSRELLERAEQRVDDRWQVREAGKVAKVARQHPKRLLQLEPLAE